MFRFSDYAYPAVHTPVVPHPHTVTSRGSNTGTRLQLLVTTSCDKTGLHTACDERVGHHRSKCRPQCLLLKARPTQPSTSTLSRLGVRICTCACAYTEDDWCPVVGLLAQRDHASGGSEVAGQSAQEGGGGGGATSTSWGSASGQGGPAGQSQGEASSNYATTAATQTGDTDVELAL